MFCGPFAENEFLHGVSISFSWWVEVDVDTNQETFGTNQVKTLFLCQPQEGEEVNPSADYVRRHLASLLPQGDTTVLV